MAHAGAAAAERGYVTDDDFARAVKKFAAHTAAPKVRAEQRMRFLYDTNVLATMTRREELARFRNLLETPANVHVTSDYILARTRGCSPDKIWLHKSKSQSDQ